eukprot:TRINITY_DN3190_c0_g1_i1.p3 TRINITY_DN3190_c0_g1~~TRINITY_DN3190_c0_g1_i1.p3  ORF type:complete len:300 (-),score=38.59 TRINITY_DN3190_c0_g1_i1:141-1040(-)
MFEDFDTLLHVSDKDVVSDTLWTLANLTDTYKKAIKLIREHFSIKRVVSLMTEQEAIIRTPAIRIIGNMCTGAQDDVEEVIQSGGLEALQLLLTDPLYAAHKKEVCWTLSNVAAGPNSHVKRLLDADFFAELSQIVQSSPAFSIKKEAAWAIANACSEASEYQCMKLVEAGVIPALIRGATIPDPTLQEITVEAIDHLLYSGYSMDTDNQIASIFEEQGGVRVLEGLQAHMNQKIQDKVVKMLQTYFEDYSCMETGKTMYASMVIGEMKPDVDEGYNEIEKHKPLHIPQYYYNGVNVYF